MSFRKKFPQMEPEINPSNNPMPTARREKNKPSPQHWHVPILPQLPHKSLEKYLHDFAASYPFTLDSTAIQKHAQTNLSMAKIQNLQAGGWEILTHRWSKLWLSAKLSSIASRGSLASLKPLPPSSFYTFVTVIRVVCRSPTSVSW